MPDPDGPTVRVLSTKYDGSRHYELVGTLLAHEGEQLTVHIAEGSPVSGLRGDTNVEVAFTALFWTDRWYNVYHNYRRAGRRGMLSYANVATPATLDGDTLRWIDLDLDVVVLDDGTHALWDADEFERHRRAFGYPADVVERALAAQDELLAAARTRAFPFDREAHLRDGAGG